MKTIKSFITLLLLMVCTAVEAQTVVVVEKTDGTKDEYPIAEVDSVVYKPVSPYYYYAGWTLPTSEEDLAALAKTTEEDGNGVSYKAAEIGSSITGFTYDFSDDGKGLTNSVISRDTFYFILPNGLSLYDNLGLDAVEDQFNTETASWNDKYTIYTSKAGVYQMDYLNIK